MWHESWSAAKVSSSMSSNGTQMSMMTKYLMPTGGCAACMIAWKVYLISQTRIQDKELDLTLEVFNLCGFTKTLQPRKALSENELASVCTDRNLNLWPGQLISSDNSISTKQSHVPSMWPRSFPEKGKPHIPSVLEHNYLSRQSYVADNVLFIACINQIKGWRGRLKTAF